LLSHICIGLAPFNLFKVFQSRSEILDALRVGDRLVYDLLNLVEKLVCDVDDPLCFFGFLVADDIDDFCLRLGFRLAS
jgi:hypothetical protein